jgi:hypothetical protein
MKTRIMPPDESVFQFLPSQLLQQDMVQFGITGGDVGTHRV